MTLQYANYTAELCHNIILEKRTESDLNGKNFVIKKRLRKIILAACCEIK